MIEVSFRSLNHMESPHINRTLERPKLPNERAYPMETLTSQFDPKRKWR